MDKQRNAAVRGARAATIATAMAAAFAAPMDAETLYDGGNPDDLAAWNAAHGNVIRLGEGQSAAITNGTFSVTAANNNRLVDMAAGSTFRVLKGASLVASGSVGTTSRPFGFALTAEGSRFVIDGGNAKVATASIQMPFASFTHGAVFEISGTGASFASDAQGAYMRLQGTNNVMSVTDGAVLDTTKYTSESYKDRTFSILNARNCILAVTNSTLKQSFPLRIGTDTLFAAGNVATFHDAVIEAFNSATLEFGALAVSNRVAVSGASGSFGFGSVTMGGEGNVFELALGEGASFAPTVTLAGNGNTVRFSGTKTVSGGYWFPAFGAGSGMTIDITGRFAKTASTKFEFSGTNATIRVRGGGRLIQANSGSAARDSFKFLPGGTKDFTFSVEDGGAVILSNSVNMASNDGANAYDWTNCPNSRIRFSGASPSLVVDYSNVYQTMVLGTEDETPLQDAVALEFEIPSGGWAEAPLRSLDDSAANREFVLYGNQPIVVTLSKELAKSEHRKMHVPLIYDVNGFCSGLNNAHSRKAPLDAARVAKLNANATLPEGAFLYYDENARALCVQIPSSVFATVVSFR